MSGPSILIVDDNELNLRAAETLLTEAGFETELARNATEARAAMTARPWAAVLIDLSLPDADGLDVIRQFRAHERTARVPMAALTASAMIGDAERALAAGADTHITKPVDPLTFIGDVRALVATTRDEPYGSA